MDAIKSVLRPDFIPYTMEVAVNETCDSLIGIINVRRQELIDLIKVREQELKDIKTCKERANLEFIEADRLAEVSSSMWYTFPESFISKLHENAYIKERRAYGEHELSVYCDKKAFRETLFEATNVYLKVLNPGIMKYKFDTPQQHGIIGKGGKGSSSADDYLSPMSIAFDDVTQELFIADFGNHRIAICNETGDYVKCFGDNKLIGRPCSIAVTTNYIYTGELGRPGKPSRGIFKFDRLYNFLKNAHMPLGSENAAAAPCSIAIDCKSDVYVCDENNSRIIIYSEDLVQKQNLTHEKMENVEIRDVKLRGSNMYVLVAGGVHCVLIFDNNQYMRSIIQCGEGIEQVKWGLYFTLDKRNNIIISDYSAHNINIYSSQGKLLNIIGKEGRLDRGALFYPRGICITNQGSIICVNKHDKYSIQLFY